MVEILETETLVSKHSGWEMMKPALQVTSSSQLSERLLIRIYTNDYNPESFCVEF